jgi:hypothetical protein
MTHRLLNLVFATPVMHRIDRVVSPVLDRPARGAVSLVFIIDNRLHKA